MIQNARYIGVFFDTGLTGTAHLKCVSAKVQRVALSLAKVLLRIGEASGRNRGLPASVTELADLYAVAVRGIWRCARRGIEARLSRCNGQWRSRPAGRTVQYRLNPSWFYIKCLGPLIGERSSRLRVNDSNLAVATINSPAEKWTMVGPGRLIKLDGGPDTSECGQTPLGNWHTCTQGTNNSGPI